MTYNKQIIKDITLFVALIAFLALSLEFGAKLAHYIVHDIFKQLEMFQGPSIELRVTTLLLSLIIPFALAIFIIKKYFVYKKVAYALLSVIFILFVYVMFTTG